MYSVSVPASRASFREEKAPAGSEAATASHRRKIISCPMVPRTFSTFSRLTAPSVEASTLSVRERASRRPPSASEAMIFRASVS